MIKKILLYGIGVLGFFFLLWVGINSFPFSEPEPLWKQENSNKKISITKFGEALGAFSEDLKKNEILDTLEVNLYMLTFPLKREANLFWTTTEESRWSHILKDFYTFQKILSQYPDLESSFEKLMNLTQGDSVLSIAKGDKLAFLDLNRFGGALAWHAMVSGNMEKSFKILQHLLDTNNSLLRTPSTSIEILFGSSGLEQTLIFWELFSKASITSGKSPPNPTLQISDDSFSCERVLKFEYLFTLQVLQMAKEGTKGIRSWLGLYNHSRTLQTLNELFGNFRDHWEKNKEFSEKYIIDQGSFLRSQAKGLLRRLVNPLGKDFLALSAHFDFLDICNMLQKSKKEIDQSLKIISTILDSTNDKPAKVGSKDQIRVLIRTLSSSRDEWNQGLQQGSLDQLLEPQFHPSSGNLEGARVLQVPRGSILEKIGLEVRDLIQNQEIQQNTSPDSDLTSLSILSENFSFLTKEPFSGTERGFKIERNGSIIHIIFIFQ